MEFKDQDLNLKFQKENNLEPKRRTYTVYLDTILGIPLKIVSQIEDFDETKWNKPSKKEAEKQLMTICDKHTRLPDKKPKISFQNAFDTLIYYNQNVLDAEEIIAIYTMNSFLEKEEVPIWEFHFYGVKDYCREQIP